MVDYFCLFDTKNIAAVAKLVAGFYQCKLKKQARSAAESPKATADDAKEEGAEGGNDASPGPTGKEKECGDKKEKKKTKKAKKVRMCLSQKSFSRCVL